MAHGVARLSPMYCTDHMRYRSLGYDEAVMWDKYVIAVQDEHYSPENDGTRNNKALIANQATATGVAEGEVLEAQGEKEQLPRHPKVNTQLLYWGMNAETARDAVNPGFVDPFHPQDTVTLDNPTYKLFGVSFMKGKLDWVLLRRVVPLVQELGNDAYALSDHRWMSVEAVIE